MPKPESPVGFVYFIQPVDGGLIKIGWALDPDLRLTQLQCGSPLKLRICRTHPGTRLDEMALHRVFAELREHGEWFRAHPSLANVADAIPDPEIAPSALCPAANVTDEVRTRIYRSEWRTAAHSRAFCPQRPPTDPLDALQRAGRYEPLTALPEDMEPESEWRQTSA